MPASATPAAQPLRPLPTPLPHTLLPGAPAGTLAVRLHKAPDAWLRYCCNHPSGMFGQRLCRIAAAMPYAAATSIHELLSTLLPVLKCHKCASPAPCSLSSSTDRRLKLPTPPLQPASLPDSGKLVLSCPQAVMPHANMLPTPLQAPPAPMPLLRHTEQWPGCCTSLPHCLKVAYSRSLL